MKVIKILIFFIFIFSSLSLADDYPVETIIQLGHTSNVLAVDFNQKGDLLVTASSDHSIIIWDINTGKRVSVIDTKQGV